MGGGHHFWGGGAFRLTEAYSSLRPLDRKAMAGGGKGGMWGVIWGGNLGGVIWGSNLGGGTIGGGTTWGGAPLLGWGGVLQVD